MRKASSALSCELSGGDHETRNLVLWLCFSAAAVAVVCCVGALALLSGPSAPRYSAAVIPPLGSAAPLSAPAPNSSAEQPPPAALVAPAPSIIQEQSLEAPPEVVRPRAKRDIARLESAPSPPWRPVVPPLPPVRPGADLGDAFARAAAHSPLTAVYDISAHTVTLPDGTRLEAHSGLGLLLDDPRSVTEADRGATPPHLYDLTPREEIFHGVQALRLNPIGEGDMFGRNGLLAHSYMLGPRGDSNGCVSFKDYDAFLKAYQSGQVKRLAVVARL